MQYAAKFVYLTNCLYRVISASAWRHHPAGHNHRGSIISQSATPSSSNWPLLPSMHRVG